MDLIKNNLANILTVGRIALLPVVVWLFYLESSLGDLAMWVCLFVYILIALSDFFDGYIARKYGQITWFGTFLDPIADKVVVSTLLVLLVAFDKVTDTGIIFVILIFAREFLISGLREFLGPKNIKMPVTNLAKWKTSVQMLSLGFLIIADKAPYAGELGLLLLAFAAFLTVWTGASYMASSIKHMKD